MYVSFVHNVGDDVNLHAGSQEKTGTLSIRTTKLTSHSYSTHTHTHTYTHAHTHTHTLSRSKAERSWMSEISRQTSPLLFRCGSEFVGSSCVSVLHSHCFGLEVFHKSVFSCGRDQDDSQSNNIGSLEKEKCINPF